MSTLLVEDKVVDSNILERIESFMTKALLLEVRSLMVIIDFRFFFMNSFIFCCLGKTSHRTIKKQLLISIRPGKVENRK